MASNATSLLTQGIIAQAAIAKNQPITKTGTVAAAGGTCIGFSQTSAAIGERVGITVLGSGIGVAGGTIAANAALQVGANGTVITQSTGAIIGRAMNAAVLGDHVEVFIAPHGNVSAGENPVTGVLELSAAGVAIQSAAINPFYHFHGFAGNQMLGDPKFYDIAAGNHGVLGANLSNAAAFANAGYVSTVDPAGGLTDSVIRIPSLNFDYSGGEKLIVWWLGAATPEGADVTLMGDGSNTTAGNQGVRVRMTTAGKMSLVLYGQGNSVFSGTTSGTAFDGALHSCAMVFDGANKKYGMWVDDALDAIIPNTYAAFNSGVDIDTKTTNTWNIGASSKSPGGTEGSAVKTRALVILRLSASATMPLAAELTTVFKQLRANASRAIASGVI